MPIQLVLLKGGLVTWIWLVGSQSTVRKFDDFQVKYNSLSLLFCALTVKNGSAIYIQTLKSRKVCFEGSVNVVVLDSSVHHMRQRPQDVAAL